jgi:hypothetical protein
LCFFSHKEADDLTTPISHEVRIGDVLYRARGDVSEENMARLEVTIVYPNGSISYLGALVLPLFRAKGVKKVIFGALREVERVEANLAYRFDDLRREYPQSHMPWDTEIDAELAQRHESGESIESISEDMGRKPSAIQSRLYKLGKVPDWHFTPEESST